MLKIRLNRDLRKNLLRGHPWVYRESLESLPKVQEACLCQLQDRKGQLIGWGIYCPKSPLAFRLLSAEKRPPNRDFYKTRLDRALQLRKSLVGSNTNAYRLVNGEGDLLPGFVCDIYNQVAVFQFDGEACYEFWDVDFLAQWALQNTPATSVYLKPRRSDSFEPQVWGEEVDFHRVEILENDIQFDVNVVEGQKTGFFLDQRQNRFYLKNSLEGKSFLNLFSYTGGFSVYAGEAGASLVTSVDVASGAIDMSEQNWQKNSLPEDRHQTYCADVFEFIDHTQEQWDAVMVDPPSMTHSEKTKKQAVENYVDLFAKSLRRVKPRGELFLSSCSSHISFEDFLEITNEALSRQRRNGQILNVAGQGFDHPFPHYAHELRYLKFIHLQLLS